MSAFGNSFQDTDASFQIIETILKKEIKKPLNFVYKSDTVGIPLINGEWYMTIQNGCIRFYMDIIIENEVELVKDKNSKDDEYCFEVTFNDRKCKSSGVKTISAQIREDFAVDADSYGDYKIWNIEAKVTIKKYQKSTKFMKLIDDFSALMSDTTHSDFTIIVKSKEFKVHKAVLSARSPVFKMMFLSNMKEAADNKAEITDIEPSTFEKLLDFIYCGKIPKDLDNYAMDLFVAADKYGIQDLKDVCETYISMNVTKENAMAVFKLANLYECHHDLKSISLKAIKEKLEEPIIVGESLENLDWEALEILLKNKKSIETLLIKSFKNDENADKSDNEEEFEYSDEYRDRYGF